MHLELGWLFKIGFAVVKNFLSKRTVENIKLLNTHADLKQYFDEDQLMKEHSGTSEWVYDGAKEYGFWRIFHCIQGSSFMFL